MTTEQKRISIEDNYINGNFSDARTQFKKMNKTERKEFASDRALSCGYVEEGKARHNAMNFADFLIKNI